MGQDPRGNPWLAERPAPARPEPRPKITEVVTVDLDSELMQRIRTAVAVACTGPPVRELNSITRFSEAAGRRKIAALRAEHNRGRRWPAVKQLPRGGTRRTAEQAVQAPSPVRSTPPLSIDLVDEVRGFVHRTAIRAGKPGEGILSHRAFFTVAAREYIDELEREDNDGKPWPVYSGAAPRGARRS
ncbi:hypothetical protein [Umezawaea beigongshangensis]|uniref:hypothetical protein n=1 Tax=Umezawaea beigongshangensis TaxID=2780383 RepID=UPI0018F2088D|nr:hypothetical protein [Umezawaea beigongshangensis]